MWTCWMEVTPPSILAIRSREDILSMGRIAVLPTSCNTLEPRGIKAGSALWLLNSSFIVLYVAILIMKLSAQLKQTTKYQYPLPRILPHNTSFLRKTYKLSIAIIIGATSYSIHYQPHLPKLHSSLPIDQPSSQAL